MAFPLGHTDNLVPHLEPAIEIRRAARNEFLDHAVAVLAGKDGPDSDQGQLDANGKILKGRRAHVAGVRVVKAGQCGQI